MTNERIAKLNRQYSLAVDEIISAIADRRIFGYVNGIDLLIDIREECFENKDYAPLKKEIAELFVKSSKAVRLLSKTEVNGMSKENLIFVSDLTAQRANPLKYS